MSTRNESGRRFVVQKHFTPQGVHWDLMLEGGDLLRTWRVDVPPAEWKGQKLTAVRIFDHDLRFLEYEGPVQKDTGRVEMEDRGTWVAANETDTQISGTFSGELVRGEVTLRQKHGARWELQLA